MSYAHLEASTREWVPTHLIQFTPEIGRAPAPVHVMLLTGHPAHGDGPAYSRAEWLSQAQPLWRRLGDGSWECQGQPTPGGRVGTVRVEKLTEEQGRAAVLLAAYAAAASLEPEDGDEDLQGTIPNGRKWKATRRALARLWALWRLLAARAGRTGEGLELLTEDGGSVWISTVQSGRGRMFAVAVLNDGRVHFHREAGADTEEPVVVEPWEQTQGMTTNKAGR